MPDYTIAYVYQLSDFSTTGGNITPPDEQGARAQGNPPFNITLNPGAVPIPIIITDDDTLFHETGGTDPSQPLAQAVTIDGVTYPAGSHVVLNYVLTDANGFEGYSITIGSSNSGNNDTTAFVTTEPMVPGQQYTFISEGNIGNNNPVDYAEFACFTAGARVKTPSGAQRIERLRAGDLVCTLDRGPQPVRWIGMRRVTGFGPLAPVEITRGTLRAHRPHLVSPQHRVLVRGAGAELHFGQSEVFVAAKHLVNGTSIRRAPRPRVTYIHLAFDHHEVLIVDGVRSESLLLAQGSLRCMCPDQSAELHAVFPDLNAQNAPVHAAPGRPEARQYEGRLIGAALQAG